MRQFVGQFGGSPLCGHAQAIGTAQCRDGRFDGLSRESGGLRCCAMQTRFERLDDGIPQQADLAFQCGYTQWLEKLALHQ
jgi:hypothetical protein